MLGKMKTLFSWTLPFLCFCASATLSAAGDFQSAVITGGTSLTQPIIVPDDHFLVIRNFTQVSQGPPASRGVVTVINLNGQKMVNADILTAAIIDPTNPSPGSLEVINNVVVAGRATVTATCPTGATCFITYRTGED